jgi:hypothetical protein
LAVRHRLPPGDLTPCLWLDCPQNSFSRLGYWPEYRLGVEGDGFGKYLLADPAKAMRNEKKREWDLQTMGIRVIRYTWPVAFRAPHELVERVGAAMARPPC